jgi:hypothetical protein
VAAHPLRELYTGLPIDEFDKSAQPLTHGFVARAARLSRGDLLTKLLLIGDKAFDDTLAN